MNMPTFYDALEHIIGEGKAGGGSTDGPISEIIFLDGVAKPTDAEVNTKLTELQAAYPLQELREKRNVLLASSDWTGLSDLALTNEKSAEWKLYRQKLRNLPDGLDTVKKVKAVTWPTKPE